MHLITLVVFHPLSIAQRLVFLIIWPFYCFQDKVWLVFQIITLLNNVQMVFSFFRHLQVDIDIMPCLPPALELRVLNHTPPPLWNLVSARARCNQ